MRAAIVLAASFLVVAGCATSPPEPQGTFLQFREHASLGPILADGDGRTLYIFTNDEKGKSHCFDQCAVNWPPAMAAAVGSVPASIRGKVSLVERDGAMQLAYEGWPLYYWKNDAAAGDATGDAVGGVWFVVREPVADPWGMGPIQVVGSDVQYTSGVTGYHARPATGRAATGVVMIHEWWGLNAEIRGMADRLAAQGYQVLAVDLFGSVATTPDEARQQVQSLNQSKATTNMRQAAAYLRTQGATSIASLGWCFGGAQSLQLATSGEALVATVLYYGSPITDSRLQAIDWPVLGIFAENDASIPKEKAQEFRQALMDAGVDGTVLVYPDVGHAFANPTGNAWAPIQTHDAWQRTLAFLEANKE
jgi:dienelactone hydrolase/predicted lipoprotein with Yx(FWY)xxD motif